jgi:hypothetical protein
MNNTVFWDIAAHNLKLSEVSEESAASVFRVERDLLALLLPRRTQFTLLDVC